MNDDDVGRLTAREWLAARIVIIGGFAVAIAVAAFVSWNQYHEAQQTTAQQTQLQSAVSAASVQSHAAIMKANAQAGAILCVREIVNAQVMGIVPPYGVLTSYVPQPTKTTGRYSCSAGTDVAKYTITGDLVCRNLKKEKCVKIVSITRDDGTVLYQNKN